MTATRKITMVQHNVYQLQKTENNLPMGTEITVTHCDGKIINEKIEELIWFANMYFYVCASAAVYTEYDLVRLLPEQFKIQN